MQAPSSPAPECSVLFAGQRRAVGALDCRASSEPGQTLVKLLAADSETKTWKATSIFSVQLFARQLTKTARRRRAAVRPTPAAEAASQRRPLGSQVTTALAHLRLLVALGTGTTPATGDCPLRCRPQLATLPQCPQHCAPLCHETLPELQPEEPADAAGLPRGRGGAEGHLENHCNPDCSGQRPTERHENWTTKPPHELGRSTPE
mmetsp:Transcript_84448/g.225659  ORF Transcript_84448/g.225659 Transcript_84448/m.225659 type:complete len:205 (+) Transcript_84448:520-1134(+)